MAASKEKYCNYLVLDCETGGKDCNKNPMTQFAIIVLDGKSLNEIYRYSTFIKSYGEEKGLIIEQEALDYTGITRSQMASGIHIVEFVKQLIAIAKIARTHNTHVAYRPIIVGHNVQFDIGFLEYAFSYAKEDLWKYVQKDYFCTMRLSHLRSYPEGPDLKYNLEACCERVNVELLDGHDAMNDTIATKELFVDHVKTLRSGIADQQTSDSTEERFRDSFKFEI